MKSANSNRRLFQRLRETLFKVEARERNFDDSRAILDEIAAQRCKTLGCVRKLLEIDDLRVRMDKLDSLEKLEPDSECVWRNWFNDVLVRVNEVERLYRRQR
jgi:hypothetical protein